MPTRQFRSYHHYLITESKNRFEDVKAWLETFAMGDWEMEKLEVPHALETYASIYLEEKSDYFLFKMRWDIEE